MPGSALGSVRRRRSSTRDCSRRLPVSPRKHGPACWSTRSSGRRCSGAPGTRRGRRGGGRAFGPEGVPVRVRGLRRASGAAAPRAGEGPGPLQRRRRPVAERPAAGAAADPLRSARARSTAPISSSSFSSLPPTTSSPSSTATVSVSTPSSGPRSWSRRSSDPGRRHRGRDLEDRGSREPRRLRVDRRRLPPRRPGRRLPDPRPRRRRIEGRALALRRRPHPGLRRLRRRPHDLVGRDRRPPRRRGRPPGNRRDDRRPLPPLRRRLPQCRPIMPTPTRPEPQLTTASYSPGGVSVAA